MHLWTKVTKLERNVRQKWQILKAIEKAMEKQRENSLNKLTEESKQTHPIAITYNRTIANIKSIVEYTSSCYRPISISKHFFENHVS